MWMSWMTSASALKGRSMSRSNVQTGLLLRLVASGLSTGPSREASAPATGAL
ncbi:unnamed protein product [Symbiodinium necroappetens]|uniref:Uncharacterized protein n=1 Tax=Symbiodinium necroappetens TaxID=1628268 RepID=A0A812ZWW9_9DINO|nr:unnamed protein product [Symbiodinium necroappetens]